MMDRHLPIADHSTVRVLGDCVVEGHRLVKNALGVVVFVYGTGDAYAVELEDLAGETVVVTLHATDVEEAVQQ